MKKILIVVAVLLTATFAQAASFVWSARNVYNYGGSAKIGTDVDIVMHCVEVADWSKTFNLTSAGTMSSTATDVDNNVIATISSELFKVGTNYSFYFTFEDGNYLYTSNTTVSQAQQSDIPSLSFGSQYSTSQSTATGTWTPVPEPTSGLLLLMGMGALALRRKQK